MASAQESPTVPSGAEPSVTAIEQRGIEHVPQNARWGKPSGLFWMWAGAVWNVEFVVYGALAVVVFGLSFAQAVLVILIGNLFYLLTGLASLQGPAAGTTAHSLGLSYQLAAGFNQLVWAGVTPFHTTGWLAIGCTNEESRIS